jgi:cAMP phosphodiesterase
MHTEGFQIVVLGCTGGPRENNLSGYLMSPLESQEWIVLDAGSLISGIDCALAKDSLKDVHFSSSALVPAGEMLTGHVRCFLISHAHLDHIAGLVLNSQADGKKSILGIAPTIDNIRDHIFNGRIWPNYGNEGLEPILNRYVYVRLPLHQSQPIPNTSMKVEAYLLSHPRGYPSTAFLIEYKGQYLLYFGDTSSDFVEEEKHLTRIWKRVAPLVKEKRLRGILLECSFSQKDSEFVEYGHLDPRLMMKEFHELSQIAQERLNHLKVMVTHRKESLIKGNDALENIKQELFEKNDLGIDFIFPTQGERYLF